MNYMTVAILYAGQNWASKSTTGTFYYKQNIPKIYQIIPKYISKIYKIYKINTKRPGPAQARPKPGAAQGPARDPRPRAWAGLAPGRAGGRWVFCIYLEYLRYMDIFVWYIFVPAECTKL